MAKLRHGPRFGGGKICEPHYRYDKAIDDGLRGAPWFANTPRSGSLSANLRIAKAQANHPHSRAKFGKLPGQDAPTLQTDNSAEIAMIGRVRQAIQILNFGLAELSEARAVTPMVNRKAVTDIIVKLRKSIRDA